MTQPPNHTHTHGDDNPEAAAMAAIIFGHGRTDRPADTDNPDGLAKWMAYGNVDSTDSDSQDDDKA